VKPYRNELTVPYEIEAAARWYELRDRGLGFQFLNAIEAAMEKICDAPSAWALWPGAPVALEVRRFVLRRFPFAIAYLDEPTEVVVLAVAHAKRRPLYWLRRGR
jgi:toxin ParE1/3/4